MEGNFQIKAQVGGAQTKPGGLAELRGQRPDFGKAKHLGFLGSELMTDHQGCGEGALAVSGSTTYERKLPKGRKSTPCKEQTKQKNNINLCFETYLVK